MKKGDKLICINDSGFEQFIRNGKTYTVESVKDNWVRVIRDDGRYLGGYERSRFRLDSNASESFGPGLRQAYKPQPAGQKLDDGKLPLQLLDPAALEEVAKVLAFGAKKYAPNNWRKGLSYTRVLGATLRHLFAFARGEDNDPETGLSHIAHAKCELMFLLSYIVSKRSDLDDRVGK